MNDQRFLVINKIEGTEDLAISAQGVVRQVLSGDRFLVTFLNGGRPYSQVKSLNDMMSWIFFDTDADVSAFVASFDKPVDKPVDKPKDPALSATAAHRADFVSSNTYALEPVTAGAQSSEEPWVDTVPIELLPPEQTGAEK